MMTKLLLETLKTADDGHVECSVATPDGSVVRGVIEPSFFEEFVMAQPVAAQVQHDEQAKKRAEVARQQRIVRDNASFLEGEFDKQWRMGGRAFVLR
ncbi:MAG: hypothetical protein EOP20_00890 [Hyphomicrobiales bacterium]|nr:MAG: hypothetical protein EOP20_00890 [Hyphomicrobiales bacterium]